MGPAIDRTQLIKMGLRDRKALLVRCILYVQICAIKPCSNARHARLRKRNRSGVVLASLVSEVDDNLSLLLDLLQ